MSLFVARIKGFVRFKDLMGQLVSGFEIEVPPQCAGLFVECIKPVVYYDYHGDCIFKNVYESQYYELSGIFDEWPGYV